MNYPKSNADKVTHCKHSFQNEYNSTILVKENKVAMLKGRYTLGDKLQQQVMATDHSVCTGLATSCSNMLWRHIVETNHFVCTGEILWKNLCLCNRILLPWQVTQILSDLIFCNTLLRQNSVAEQRFSQKYSSTHEAICCCDVPSRHAAATCRLVCTDLKPTGLEALLWLTIYFPFFTLYSTMKVISNMEKQLEKCWLGKPSNCLKITISY